MSIKRIAAKSFPVEKLKNMVLQYNGNKFCQFYICPWWKQSEFNLANELGGDNY